MAEIELVEPEPTVPLRNLEAALDEWFVDDWRNSSGFQGVLKNHGITFPVKTRKFVVEVEERKVKTLRSALNGVALSCTEVDE